MRKILSILFVLLIILSGMHFSLAIHLCEGKLFGSKFSFSGDHVSCGMESKSEHSGKGYYLSSECCDDQTISFTVEQEFTPSPILINDVNTHELPVFLPECLACSYQKLFKSPLAVGSLCLADPVYELQQEDICVFRI